LIKIFVDGKVKTATHDNIEALSASSSISFGSLNSNTNYFVGVMDEVRIYSGVLPPSYLNTLMASPPGTICFLNRHSDCMSAVRRIIVLGPSIDDRPPPCGPMISEQPPHDNWQLRELFVEAEDTVTGFSFSYNFQRIPFLNSTGSYCFLKLV
jgi:hypothetical protein